MPLTDAACRAAKPAASAYKLADSGGLYLYVAITGGKLWRCDYRHHGKRRTASFGSYPVVSLLEARRKRDDVKRQLVDGVDPARAKAAAKAANKITTSHTFESVAREWHKMQESMWTRVHASDVLVSLERDVFPRLGQEPINAISSPDVLAVLRGIEKRGAPETARRVRQRISAIFGFAIANAWTDSDPSSVIIKAMAPVRKRKQPAITDLEKARQILRDCDAKPGNPLTKLAMRLLALTGVRPGEVRGARWVELVGLDGDAPLWLIPAERMKLRLENKDDEARDHLVPLSKQAVEALAAAHSLTGRAPLVFPNARAAHRPMSENAIGYMLNRAGYHHRHVPHGWRSTFSTIMNERHPLERHIIDFHLAHVPKDKVEGAYNRALYLDRRRELAAEWADLLMVDQAPLADLIGGVRR